MSPLPWPAGPPPYEDLPERFNIVPLLVDRHLEEGRAVRPAILTPEETLDYAALAAGVGRAANLLRRLGLSREQRVVLLLPDSPAFVFCFLGAMRAGLVPVPISTLGTSDEVAYVLQDSRAVALVTDTTLYAKVEPVRDREPTLRHCLVAGDAPPGALPLDPALEAEDPVADPAPTHRDDMAYWLYSSGTTGPPKAVIHLHHDMLYCVDPYVRHVLAMTEADRTFAVPRLFFSYGLTSCVYLPFWCGASTVLVPDRPDPKRVVEILATLRPTLFFSVPTAYAALLRELPGMRADFSSLRLCVSAGEPLPAPLYHRWVEATGVECLDGLGATEVGYIFISNRPGAVRPGSSGQLLPGYRARIRDAEGREVPPGVAGELWVAGESVAPAYWNKHARTRSAFVGEWYRTGDTYLRDADGYYFYQGRSDDLLRVGANWVSPLEVESCLLAHPAVAECAVVGAPDADGLTRPRAFVVLRSGAPADGIEEALRAHARARLAGYKVPRWVTVVEELPRTATGKVQRFRLREAPPPGTRGGGPPGTG